MSIGFARTRKIFTIEKIRSVQLYKKLKFHMEVEKEERKEETKGHKGWLP